MVLGGFFIRNESQTVAYNRKFWIVETVQQVKKAANVYFYVNCESRIFTLLSFLYQASQ